MNYNVENIDINVRMLEVNLRTARTLILSKVEEDDLDVVTGTLTDSEITDLASSIDLAGEYLDLVVKKLYQLNLISNSEGEFLKDENEVAGA
jgi:hypothetical protein